MQRREIEKIVGDQYLQANVENDEFSYSRAYKDAGLDFHPIKSKYHNRQYNTIDIRFVKDDLTVLIETKNDFSKVEKEAKDQLSAYVQYEKGLNNNKIIAILANTTQGIDSKDVKVWRGTVSDRDLLTNENVLRSIDEYQDYYSAKTNNKEQVVKNTYALNELLNSEGINEKLRSQFVGTCLLALKNTESDLLDKNMTSDAIRGEMHHVLETLLNKDLNKAEKLSLLYKNVLENQTVRELSTSAFKKILKSIKENILPFINDNSTKGQDLLNLFFVTFNKYVGKADKNQAFTPDHITDFMTKAINVNRNSKILDPTCGSGSFLVRAMTQALDDAGTAKEQENIKKQQIFGIEYDENIYGLSTTNMLIHGDGNSNIYQGSCFDYSHEIKSWNIDKVLMNPPYNATKAQMPESFVTNWTKKTKKDPSKGFYFAKYVADQVRTGEMAVLLPMAAAIGNNSTLKKFKKKMLEENTLKAVFSLPDDIFYPGASVQACCMIFELGQRHNSDVPTFFGYYKDDGFTKRKYLGRVEDVKQSGTGKWSSIEKEWLNLYRNKIEKTGMSAIKCVNAEDEWLAEAYMKTDYSKLNQDNFQRTINDYLAYLVKEGNIIEH